MKHEYADESAFAASTLPTLDCLLIFSKAARYGNVPLAELDLGALLPPPADRPAVVGVGFGSETEGVTFLPHSAAGRAVMEAATFVHLPMAPAIRSYNLATTAAIGLWEVTRQVAALSR